MTRRHRVAVIPGDGIGQEVIPAALGVLEAAAAGGGFALDVETFPWGCAHHARTGRMMDPDALDRLQGARDLLGLSGAVDGRFAAAGAVHEAAADEIAQHAAHRSAVIVREAREHLGTTDRLVLLNVGEHRLPQGGAAIGGGLLEALDAPEMTALCAGVDNAHLSEKGPDPE